MNPNGAWPDNAQLLLIQQLPGNANWTRESHMMRLGGVTGYKGAFNHFMNANPGSSPLGPAETYTATMTAGGAAAAALRTAHAAAEVACRNVPWTAQDTEMDIILDCFSVDPQIDDPVLGPLSLFNPPRAAYIPAAYPFPPGWQRNYRGGANLFRHLTRNSSPDRASPHFNILLRRLCKFWRGIVSDRQAVMADNRDVQRGEQRPNRRWRSAGAGALPARLGAQCRQPFPAEAVSIDFLWNWYKVSSGCLWCPGESGDAVDECGRELLLEPRLTAPNGQPWPDGPNGLPHVDTAVLCQSRGSHQFHHLMPNPLLVRWHSGQPVKPAAMWPVGRFRDNLRVPHCRCHCSKGNGGA